MGTFLTSVQVHLGSKPKTDTRAGVVEAVRQHVLDSGFVETNPAEDQDPDRTVLIGPAGDAPWLTVFDSQGNLRELAQHLSVLVGDAAVYMNLIDSDVVHLRLYRAGDLVDEYCNSHRKYDAHGIDAELMAEWSALSNSELRSLIRGHLAKWRDLFIEGTDTKALRAVWNSRPVNADDILWTTARALGMNAQEIWSIDQVENSTRLTFRLSAPRAYEVKAEGLPKFSLASHSLPHQVYVGEMLDLMISVQNDGGAGTGLDIVAWGSVLDNGILKLGKANILLPENPADSLAVDFMQARGKVGDQETTLYPARLESFKLPQGVQGGEQAPMQPGVDFRKAYQALLQTQVHTHVHASVETTGSGELYIAFIPHANRLEGQALYHVSLQALPAPRRPLRYAEATRPVPLDFVQSLSTPTHLFALIALDTDRVRAAALTADLLQAWAGEMAHQSGKALVTHLRPRVDLLPDNKRLTVREVADSAYWRAQREALETCVSFSMEAPGAQVIFDADPIFFQHSHEELVPQLAFAYAVEQMSAEASVSLENRQVAIVDQLMDAGAVSQAVVGRWDWGSHPAPSLNMIPYEVASGVSGQCTTARFWCRRYLRGVTEKLWLGPDLVAQLGGTDALTRIAQVTPVGNGVRIVLNEGATLDGLEAVLAPLLPGEKEWREGVARLYGRQ